MLGAGLLAKKAVEAGLARRPWVKTSPRARLEGRHRVPRAGGADRAASSARLRPRRLRLHHLHRQLGAAAGGDLARDRGARPGRRVGAVGQPQLRGPHPPRGQDELPRLAAARAWPTRWPGGWTSTSLTRAAAGRRPPRATSGPAAARGERGDRAGDRVGHVPQELRRGVRGRRELERARGARGRPLRLGPASPPTCARPPYFEGMPADAARGLRARSAARACSRCSATASPPTTSRRPGAIKKDSPAGRLPDRRTASSSATSTPTARGAATTR